MGSCWGKRKLSKTSVINKENEENSHKIEDEKQSVSVSNEYEDPVMFLPATLDYEVPTRPSLHFEDL